jgi:hypothetical protein
MERRSNPRDVARTSAIVVETFHQMSNCCICSRKASIASSAQREVSLRSLDLSRWCIIPSTKSANLSSSDRGGIKEFVPEDEDDDDDDDDGGIDIDITL